MAHPGGRPRLFKSPEEMQKRVDDYFENPPMVKVPVSGKLEKYPVITVSGLVMALGFTERHGLDNYEGYGEEFYSTVKNAKSRIAEYYEAQGQYGNGRCSSFMLNNLGFSSKTEQAIDLTSGGEKIAAPIVYLPDNGKQSD